MFKRLNLVAFRCTLQYKKQDNAIF